MKPSNARRLALAFLAGLVDGVAVLLFFSDHPSLIRRKPATMADVWLCVGANMRAAADEWKEKRWGT